MKALGVTLKTKVSESKDVSFVNYHMLASSQAKKDKGGKICEAMGKVEQRHTSLFSF